MDSNHSDRENDREASDQNQLLEQWKDSKDTPLQVLLRTWSHEKWGELGSGIPTSIRWKSAEATQRWRASMILAFQRHHPRLKAAPGQAPLTLVQRSIITELLGASMKAAWPRDTLDSLGEKVGIKKRAARNAVADLESRGLLKRIPVEGRANRFDLSGLVAQLEAFDALEVAS